MQQAIKYQPKPTEKLVLTQKGKEQIAKRACPCAWENADTCRTCKQNQSQEGK